MKELLDTEVKGCKACGLRGTCRQPVIGHGPIPSRIMLIGEAPGEREDEIGLPFVGKGGVELDNYLYRFAGVHRSQVRVANVVRCRPPMNRDPRPDEIEACRRLLEWELGVTWPRVVIAAGRFAAEWMLGNGVQMDMDHGMAHFGVRVGIGEWAGEKAQLPDDVRVWEGVVVPVYHPAAGLHETRQMRFIQDDFTAAGKVVRGEWRAVGDVLEGKEDYKWDREYDPADDEGKGEWR